MAACLAGVFSLEDALALVAARGRLMQSLPPGAMLSVRARRRAELAPLLDARLSLAAVNARGRATVAGPADAVEALAARLAEREVEHRRLRTSHAFHSAHGGAGPGGRSLEQVAPDAAAPPRDPFLSNVTGTWMTPQEATDPAYWGRHLRRPVRFAAAVHELSPSRAGPCWRSGPGRP